MARQRLTALDGLRGFAALSVVISHLGFNLHALTESPIAHYLYRMISAGTYSVQAFFVLSGFLMAFLYPTITSSFSYLAKRYLRIMPVYGTVVLYIWWHELNPHLSLLHNAVALIAIAVAVHLLWRFLERLNGRWRQVGTAVFVAFLLFQTAMVIFSLTLLPSLLAGPAAPLNELRKLLIMLANLSMTMYLQPQAIVSSGVFWSLVPEMLFYIVYPFVVVPLISLGRRWGGWASLLLTLAVLKVLFDLDTATLSLFSLHGIFVSRASGFVVGIWVGTLFRNKGTTWQTLEQWLKKPWVNWAILALFFFLLAFEWPDRFHQIRDYVRLHYLGLSLGFGLVIAAGVTPGSLIGRFFSNKVLTFLGMVSYSLYVIHPEVIARLGGSGTLWSSLTLVAVSVLAAFVLFRLVEALYFKTKNKQTKPSSAKSAQSASKKTPIGPAPWQTIIIALITSTILIAAYASSYAPSLLMTKHALPATAPFAETLITPSQPFSLSFTAVQPNLSVVFLTMDYAREPSAVRTETTANVQLVFRLFDDQGQLVFESRRRPQEVEGVPQFPFGFPTIADSAGKTYRAEWSLVDADPSDQLYVHHAPGLVSQYTTAKTLTPAYLTRLAWERLRFALSHQELLFALALVGFVTFHTVRNKTHSQA